MKPGIAVQNQNALHQKQDDPTEHRKAMDDDQGDNLAGDFASAKPLAMRKEPAESDDGRNQHYASGDHVEKPFRPQGPQSRAVLLGSNYRIRDCCRHNSCPPAAACLNRTTATTSE